MVRVACRGCGASLSAAVLEAGAGALKEDAQDREPTVAPGLVVRDPRPVIAWTGVAGQGPSEPDEVAPAGCLVTHPDDVRGLRSHGHDNGCCGSDGCDGPNRACARCGAVVGTARTDCWTASEMRFLPEAVDLS